MVSSTRRLSTRALWQTVSYKGPSRAEKTRCWKVFEVQPLPKEQTEAYQLEVVAKARADESAMSLWDLQRILATLEFREDLTMVLLHLRALSYTLFYAPNPRLARFAAP